MVQATARRKPSSGEFTIVDSAPLTPTGQRPRAVVVDDDRGIREAVSQALRTAGYSVEVGETGASALRLAQSVPDVMVLDLNLPDLSGLAICRALRAGPKTAEVPIIILTATNDDSVVASGFMAGALDYIVKPFVPEVLTVRVNRVARARLAELERKSRVQELHAATTALDEARATLAVQHKLSGLGILVSGVATEMNIPLGAITSSLQSAGENLDDPAATGILRDALASAEQLSGLVRRLRGIAGTDDRANTAINLRERCALVAHSFADVACTIGGADVVVSAVDAEFREAIIAVIDNAVRAANKRANPRIMITIFDTGASGDIVIDDSGPGIDEDDVPLLFTPFFKRADKREGNRSGVGLSLVNAAMRRHGGALTIEGHGPLGGARITLRLPKVAVEGIDVDDTPLTSILS